MSGAQWWSRAADLVNSLHFRGEDVEEAREHRQRRSRYYHDNGDSGSETDKMELMLPVLIRRGDLEFIRVKPGMRVQELLQRLTSKKNYGLVQVKRNAFNKIIGRTILEGDEQIEALNEINWAAKTPGDSSIWLVDLTQEITVFFNTYFRMVTGCPTHFQRLYAHPGMTVSEFEEELKASLGIPLGDERMGLYGYERQEVMRLDGDLLLSELMEREANPQEPSFFQFQIHPEAERDEDLGASRASSLCMRANRGTRKMKKCWFSLQGTTLFYRPSQKDHSWTRKVERIDQCKVIYRGANEARTSWRFDLVPPEGPIRIFSSPLKKRVVRWVRVLRGAHASLEINEPVSIAALMARNVDVEPSSSLLAKRTNTELTEVPFFQRRLIEMAEAHLNKIELDGGVLLLNGLEYLEESLGRKWVEAVRELLYHCIKMQATRSAWKVVSITKEILRKLKGWVQFFEGEHHQDPSPGAESIKEITEDAANLVNTFRFYVINLNTNEENLIQNRREKAELEDILEKLQDGLAEPIFQRKAGGKRRVLRGMFKPTEEILAAKKQAADAKKAAKRAQKEREARRKQRAKEDPAAVWSLASHGSPKHEYDRSYNYDEVEEQYESELGSAKKDHPMDEEVGWLQKKLSKLFHRKPMNRNVALDAEEDQVDPEDAISIQLSMENGEHLSETRWSEAEAMFRKYSSKNSGSRARNEEAHDAVEVPVIKSGFNRLGSKGLKTVPAGPNTNAASVWKMPEEPDEQAFESPALETNGNSSTDTLERLDSCGPIRAGPEEEALLLRMIKDPRMKGILEEYKQTDQPTPMQVEPVISVSQETSDAVAAWGRGRQLF